MEDNTFYRCIPEDLGITSSSIKNFIDAIEESGLELNSFMLLRHGSVAAEGYWYPYKAEYPHMLFSLSKSFTSTAVGLAVNEGYFSLDDKVLSFFPDAVYDNSNNYASLLKVRHLLTMSSGHSKETFDILQNSNNSNWVEAYLNVPFDYEPGTTFVYDSGATYMLSAIVQKTTGLKVIDYLTPRLFEPLGITGAYWDTCPAGINTGGWGLYLKTEDIAKFGQLYLQKGCWNGTQLIPEAWVEEATSYQINNGDDPHSDWSQGYGYQFWRCRHNVYRADGAFGQFCIVMPKQDTVLAITSSEGNMGAILTKVWEHLLIGIKEESLTQNEQDYLTLTNKLSSLTLLPPTSEFKPMEAIDGIIQSYEIIEDNPFGFKYIDLEIKQASCILAIKGPKESIRITCDFGSWHENSNTIMGFPGIAAGSYTYPNNDVLLAHIRLVNTPFLFKITAALNKGEMTIATGIGIGLPPLTGRKIG